MRKAKQLNGVIKCCDNAYRKCKIRVSVRNEQIALHTDAKDRWPHLTIDEAECLMELLAAAIDEADQRAQREAQAL